jgi:Xaa-Pro aminopeptidase
MATHGATHHFVSTVDDIAWITNLRGSDVSYNPVFLAHLLVDAQQARSSSAGKVAAGAAGRAGRRRRARGALRAAAAALGALQPGQVLLVDPKRSDAGLREAGGRRRAVVEAINPSTLLKSRKTAAEAAFVREAMAEDGAAMCEFYAWFEPRWRAASDDRTHRRRAALRRRARSARASSA